MTQRRMPSGQGPARRPARTSVRAPAVRAGAVRTARTTGRPTSAPVSSAPAARSGSRPAATRRATASGATKRTVAPQPRRFTGRASILLVVFGVLALGYTYPVRTYLAQESQITQMQAAQAAQRAKIASDAEQVAKWQDPEYVKTQARRRFYYVEPGEVPLVVLYDPAGAARDAGKPPPQATPPAWYDRLWSSVAAADKAAG